MCVCVFLLLARLSGSEDEDEEYEELEAVLHSQKKVRCTVCVFYCLNVIYMSVLMHVY